MPQPRHSSEAAIPKGETAKLIKRLGLIAPLTNKKTDWRLLPIVRVLYKTELDTLADEYDDQASDQLANIPAFRRRTDQLLDHYGPIIWSRLVGSAERKWLLKTDSAAADGLYPKQLYHDNPNDRLVLRDVFHQLAVVRVSRLKDDRSTPISRTAHSPEPSNKASIRAPSPRSGITEMASFGDGAVKCFAGKKTLDHLNGSLLQNAGVWLGDVNDAAKCINGKSWEQVVRYHYNAVDRPQDECLGYLLDTWQGGDDQSSKTVRCAACDKQRSKKGSSDLRLVLRTLQCDGMDPGRLSKMWSFPCRLHNRDVFALVRPDFFGATEYWQFLRVDGGYTLVMMLKTVDDASACSTFADSRNTTSSPDNEEIHRTLVRLPPTPPHESLHLPAPSKAAEPNEELGERPITHRVDSHQADTPSIVQVSSNIRATAPEFIPSFTFSNYIPTITDWAEYMNELDNQPEYELNGHAVSDNGSGTEDLIEISSEPSYEPSTRHHEEYQLPMSLLDLPAPDQAELCQTIEMPCPVGRSPAANEDTVSSRPDRLADSALFEQAPSEPDHRSRLEVASARHTPSTEDLTHSQQSLPFITTTEDAEWSTSKPVDRPSSSSSESSPAETPSTSRLRVWVRLESTPGYTAISLPSDQGVQYLFSAVHERFRYLLAGKSVLALNVTSVNGRKLDMDEEYLITTNDEETLEVVKEDVGTEPGASVRAVAVVG